MKAGIWTFAVAVRNFPAPISDNQIQLLLVAVAQSIFCSNYKKWGHMLFAGFNENYQVVNI